jgi:hypothetical protein
MFILNIKKRLLIFILVVTPITGYSMSFKKCMFSEVEGIVIQGGKPLEGATIERSYRWALPGSGKQETTQSNKDGHFHFPVMYHDGIFPSFFSSIIPHEPVITQDITIRYNEKEYEAYLFSKRDYDLNSELDGVKLKLICDLDKEASREGGFYGVCTLDEN